FTDPKSRPLSYEFARQAHDDRTRLMQEHIRKAARGIATWSATSHKVALTWQNVSMPGGGCATTFVRFRNLTTALCPTLACLATRLITCCARGRRGQAADCRNLSKTCSTPRCATRD